LTIEISLLKAYSLYKYFNALIMLCNATYKVLYGHMNHSNHRLQHTTPLESTMI